MEITFNNLRSKDVVNLYDGRRLGRITDVSFEKETGRVMGFIVPGVKKVFKKIDDIFIPLELIKKIGEDVILVKMFPLETEEVGGVNSSINNNVADKRYKRVFNK